MPAIKYVLMRMVDGKRQYWTTAHGGEWQASITGSADFPFGEASETAERLEQMGQGKIRVVSRK